MLSLAEKLRLLVEWSPLIGLISDISGASTPLDRALRTFAALRWLAGRTDTEVDDEIAAKLEAVLSTKEGRELFDYASNLIGSLVFMGPRS